MPKITRHGGPSIAGEQAVGAAATNEPDARPADDEPVPELVELPEGAEVAIANEVQVSVDGVDQGPGEVDETLGGPFKPLPEAVEGELTEHVSEPDYEAWTTRQLRDVLADRGLPTAGLKPALIERLREAEAEESDG